MIVISQVKTARPGCRKTAPEQQIRMGAGYVLMNSDRGSRETRVNVRSRLSDWRQLVDRCRRKPTRRRVHALRVLTLRIQAELEHEAADLPKASHQAQAMLRFAQLGEKLREDLGQVRELDVWIGKLQRLRAFLSETSEYVPRSTRECIRQTERLEERLEKKRRSAADKLIEEIKKHRDGWVEAGRAVEEAASEHTHQADGNEAATILREFGVVAADFSAFDEENLHDFRKRIKKVRYLAEIHSGDAECARIAAQIKKVQTAIGEWHDWQVLARTARQGRRGKNGELAELLESLTAEKFGEAVAGCDGLKARLLEPSAADRGLQKDARKPLARSEQISTPLRKLA